MKMKHAGVALLLMAFVVGCGGAEPGEGGSRKPVFKVTGKITMSGGAVSGAMVGFIPREGQPVATGRTNDSGEYTLMTYEPGDGATAGAFAVTVSKSFAGSSGPAPLVHGPDVAAGSHDAQATKAGTEDALPELYKSATTTTLEAKVTTDGENRFDFDLQ